MKNQHTPGPWDVRYFSGDHGRATVEQKREDLGKPHIPVASICEIYSSPGGNGIRSSIDNAWLIAAAPEMLELLRKCSDEQKRYNAVSLGTVDCIEDFLTLLDNPDTA